MNNAVKMWSKVDYSAELLNSQKMLQLIQC